MSKISKSGIPQITQLLTTVRTWNMQLLTDLMIRQKPRLQIRPCSGTTTGAYKRKIMEINSNDNIENQVTAEHKSYSVKMAKNRRIILIGVAMAIFAIAGFSMLNKNNSTSETDCQRLNTPVTNAMTVLLSMTDYDDYVLVYVMQTRSEQLSEISKKISGPGAELASKMSITLESIASSFSTSDYVGAPTEEFVKQFDELKSVCPSLFD